MDKLNKIAQRLGGLTGSQSQQQDLAPGGRAARASGDGSGTLSRSNSFTQAAGQAFSAIAARLSGGGSKS